MSKIRLSLILAVILGVSTAAFAAAPPADEQAEDATLDILLNAVRSNRKALVAVNLSLTEAEATAFWPIYDRYQQEMNALADRLAGVLQDYAANYRALPDDKGIKIVDDYLTIEADRIKVRRAYVEEFAKALPGRKVALFYQIENKMDALIRYELASTIPVIVDESPAAAK